MTLSTLNTALRGFALTLALALPSSADAAFDRSAWVQDFDQLLRSLDGTYANLDWAVADRGLNLKALAVEARKRLDAVQSDDEAKRLFDRFLESFGDGHLYMVWPRPARDATAVPAATAVALAAGPTRSCADMGYRKARNEELAFDSLKQYAPLRNADADVFPAGVLTLDNGRKLGILRIALFSELAFPQLCEALHGGKACDARCESGLLRAVAARLSAALARQSRVLAGQGIDMLVVDITGNGGGSNWAEAAARVLTAPGLTAPEMGFIRHPHWVRNFDAWLGDIATDLARDNLPAAVRAALTDAKAMTEKARAAAAEKCDRSAIWESGESKESGKTGENAEVCSLVVRMGVRSTGILGQRPSFDLGGLSADHVFHMPGRYAFEEGAYRGPLALLVDEKTNSAAELVAATLKDNGRATLIGSVTAGSGCGYTSGGIDTVLKQSKGRLRQPDCVRYRADGGNEVRGIEPDVLVPWRANFSRHQRTRQVMKALEGWPPPRAAS